MQTTKKILLLVSGMSPQIITETLYALITQAERWVPNEIHLVTTQQGRSNAVGQLLNDKTPIFGQLLRDYNIDQPILFDHSTIHLIEHHGQKLEDLRTPDENQAAADCISEKVRQFTQDETTELHVSLAGGRKTMGFYAGYALSLFGRAQDKLSHVLVSDRYESSDFYYPAPTPDTTWIKARDGSSLDTHKAQVWLAEIPFVRMRHGLPEKLLKGDNTFSQTIELANRAMDRINMMIYPEKNWAICNGITIKLDPSLMLILVWAAERHIGKLGPIESIVEIDELVMKAHAQELLRIADQYNINLNLRTEAKLKNNGLTQKDLEQTISKISGQFKATLGEYFANRCKLANITTSLGKGYAFPEEIHVEIQ
jgi:CRISPR-associated protein (TIGR02584 family)